MSDTWIEKLLGPGYRELTRDELLKKLEEAPHVMLMPIEHPQCAFAQDRLREAAKELVEGKYWNYVFKMRSIRATGFYEVQPDNEIQREMLSMCSLPVDLYANRLVSLWHRHKPSKTAELA